MRFSGLYRCLLSGTVLTVLAACSSTPDNTEPPAALTEFSASARVIDVWTSRISSQVNLHAYTLVPYINGETVFVTDHKGLLTAFSRDTGGLIWQKHIGSDVSTGVAGDDDKLYLGTLQGQFIALDQRDGSELWRSEMTTEIIALPTTGSGLVVARSIDGRVSLFSAADGSEIWTYSRNVPALTVRGNSPAVLVQGAVLLGLDNGKLLALRIDDGKPFWEITLSEPSGRAEIERLSDVDADIQVDAEFIYAAGFQGKLARVSPERGRIMWEREMSTIAGFRVKGDAIYVTDIDSNVWSIDRNNGAALWKQDKLRARQLTAPVPTGDYVMVGDLEGYVHWLSRTDGRLVARNRIDNSRIISAATISDDTLFVQTQYGLVAAIQIIGYEADSD